MFRVFLRLRLLVRLKAEFMVELNFPSRFLPVALSEEGLVAKYPVVEPSND